MTRSKQFKMTHDFFREDVLLFSEHSAPDWLTGEGSVRGSTMDNRWFWERHVLALEVGQSVSTDFRTIERTA